MKKSENTLLMLEAALERIIQGKPKRIPAFRKLSVRAVEEEAKLGNGTGYYYPEFVEKVKKIIVEPNCAYVQPEIESVRIKLNEQKRIKNNFKEKYEVEKAKLALFAANQHHFNDQLVKAFARINELEFENSELKERLVEAKRSGIASIKK